MSLGFESAGFKVVAAVDSSRIALDIHERNFPDCPTLCVDVAEVSGAEIRKVAKIGHRRIDVVFGGPPCQGFSIGGKGDARDPRNRLLLEFARLVVELRPRHFVVENVYGILQPQYAPLLRRFRRKLEAAGYTFAEPVKVLNAADYGVPQRRRRVFFLGSLGSATPLGYPAGSEKRVTVLDAIGDLIPAEAADLTEGDVFSGALGKPTEYSRALRAAKRGRAAASGLSGCAVTGHSKATKARFRKVKPGAADPVSRFIRLKSGGLAPTLRAGTGFDKGRFMAVRPIHPKFPRCITVREAARLHSFPDWFEFHKTKWHSFMQIGNSVPPVLARAVAKEIIRSLT